MKNIILKILFLISLFSCNQGKVKNNVTSKLFSHDEIEKQIFLISTKKDTTIIGKKGTIIKIPKYAFELINGEKVEENINIELKEVFEKSEFIYGNLTTTSNGQVLESNGMIFIDAKTIQGIKCKIVDNKSINLEVLSDKFEADMNLFEGEKSNNNSINWINPISINKQVVEKQIQEEIEVIKKDYEINFSIMNKRTVDGVIEYELPQSIHNNFMNYIEDKGGLLIKNDTILKFEGHTIYLTKADRVKFSMSEPVAGLNTFQEDEQTNYIFSLKKLGWANIDRFFTDPRNQEVELIINIDNLEEYQQIYTSMIFKNRNIYLPGYQKVDNSFSFTHGDFEKTSLPVGENAIILVTAYKDEKSYFAINNFTIDIEQHFNINLQEISKEELKVEIKKAI